MGANKKFNFVKANKPKKYEFLAASPERRDDGSKLQAAFYMSRNYSLRWACVCVCECANIKNISGKGGGWNWDEYPGSPASWQPGSPASRNPGRRKTDSAVVPVVAGIILRHLSQSWHGRMTGCRPAAWIGPGAGRGQDADALATAVLEKLEVLFAHIHVHTPIYFNTIWNFFAWPCLASNQRVGRR